ncbi:MAG: hypothetical protein AB7F32_09930 [Victivallaceae bacterium]
MLLFAFNFAAASETPQRLTSSGFRTVEVLRNAVAGLAESMPFPVGYVLCDVLEQSPLLKESENQNQSVALPVLLWLLLSFLILPVLLAPGVAAATRGRMNYLRQIFARLIPVRAGPCINFSC